MHRRCDLNPIILADNRFADGIPTATDTAVDYDVLNIKDLRPYTFWKGASVGTKYLTVQSTIANIGNPIVADACAIDGTSAWVKAVGTLVFSTDHYDIAHSGTAQVYFPSAVFTLTPGKLYRVIVEFKNGTASGVSVQFGVATTGGSFVWSKTITTTATSTLQELLFAANGTEKYIGVFPGSLSGNNIQIKNVSLYEQSGGLVDTLGIIGHNLFTASALVSVESSVDNSTWTERLAAFTPASDRALLKLLTSAQGAYWRLKIVTTSIAAYVGVVMLGTRITFPYPPDISYDPYNEGIEAESETSVSGNPLGSVVKYFPVELNPRFSFLLRSWVTGTYKPFWDDYARYLKLFFWAWDLTTWPDLVHFVRMKPDARFKMPVSMLDYADELTLEMEGTVEP